VLRTIAERIRATTRESDLIGRLGGDEFVVVADPVSDVDEAVALAHRIRAAISEPVPTATTSVTPGASIGIAMGGCEDLTPDEILRDADLAVYRAKEQGSGVEVCDVELRDELAHRYSVEEQLAEAIEHDDLVLHFQAVVDSRDGVPVGVEALVRWPRHDGTVVPPDQFIPIAERSDLIIDVDRWVVERAVLQLAEWTAHPVLGSLSMSVNISARHVSTRGFAGEVMDTLHRHGVEPHRLVVEVTESALLADLEHVVTELEHLRRRGVRIAIDDFGTGYTSLALLLQLPIDVLKLDRSLIERLEDPKDRSIVQLIVDTGHLLGVTITAEGIETAAQASELAELGSDHLQGFLFARPVPAPELATNLEAAHAG
jgi:predicted signal transduction protein with EAL and GGDEF domain